jgi:hypothetical protein
LATWLLITALVALLLTPLSASAELDVRDYWFRSSITTIPFTGALRLRAELNYDDERQGAPIAVVMPGFSPMTGNFDHVRERAQNLADEGFFAISVAMRGRDGSEGVRDSGGLEVHDIWDAVESVKRAFPAFVDPTNVHITGYSGGGGNVMAALVRFPDYFRLGSSYYGMSDYGFDPVSGWYNNGADGRTAELDRDIGDPNSGDPLVLDRYHARAANLAAANSRLSEVHLFVNDDETIAPPVNHASFTANGGPLVTNHVGNAAAPTYEDFNGNAKENLGERQLWPHGFPSYPEQEAAEQWYRGRLLSGEIPEPSLPMADTFLVPGFLKTRHFEVWLGDGQNAAGEVSYELGETSAWFEIEIESSDDSVEIRLVVHSGFMAPANRAVQAHADGRLLGTFPIGASGVLTGIEDGDRVVLSLPSEVSALRGNPVWVAVCAAAMAAVGHYRLRGSGPGRRSQRRSTPRGLPERSTS